MSLAKDRDLIIPGTTGIITALSKEANQYNKTEKKELDLAQYISQADIVYNVVNNRAKGVPLERLVNPSRISNDTKRINNEQEIERSTATGRGGFYSELVEKSRD